MKRRVTREEIIRTTRDLIIRNGIRAVRVDEIAQKLEISKRTLYELFSDKDTLVEQCWDKIREEQEKKIFLQLSGNRLLPAKWIQTVLLKKYTRI